MTPAIIKAYNKKNCVLCNKPFYCFKRRRRGKRNPRVKPMRAVTCSHNCSRIFARIRNRRNHSKVINQKSKGLYTTTTSLYCLPEMEAKNRGVGLNT